MGASKKKRQQKMGGVTDMKDTKLYSQKLQEIALRGPIFQSPKYETLETERDVVLFFGPYGTVMMSC